MANNIPISQFNDEHSRQITLIGTAIKAKEKQLTDLVNKTELAACVDTDLDNGYLYINLDKCKVCKMVEVPKSKKGVLSVPETQTVEQCTYPGGLKTPVFANQSKQLIKDILQLKDKLATENETYETLLIQQYGYNPTTAAQQNQNMQNSANSMMLWKTRAPWIIGFAILAIVAFFIYKKFLK